MVTLRKQAQASAPAPAMQEEEPLAPIGGRWAEVKAELERLENKRAAAFKALNETETELSTTSQLSQSKQATFAEQAAAQERVRGLEAKRKQITSILEETVAQHKVAADREREIEMHAARIEGHIVAEASRLTGYFDQQEQEHKQALEILAQGRQRSLASIEKMLADLAGWIGQPLADDLRKQVGLGH